VARGLINDHILRRLTKKFIFKWVGLFPADEERKQKRLELASTWNEVRAIDGKEPLEDDLLGNAPINANLMGVYMQANGLGPMQPGDGQGGDQGQGGFGNDPPAFGLPDSERPLGGAAKGGPERNAAGAERSAQRQERRTIAKSRLIVELRDLPPVRVEDLP